MTGDLIGRVAVITGAGQGIGACTAAFLAKHGAEVVVADKDIDAARQTAKGICEAGFLANALYLDVLDEITVKDMTENVVQRSGKIDILVNSAGVLDATPISEMTMERWDFVIDVDLRGTHLCSQACLPYMFEKKYGKIVNIASQAGQLGGFLAGVNYTAAKGGVIAMTKAYARYCAGHQVTVNCVSPGFIETDMTKGRGDDAQTVPLKRLGTPLDCAKAIYFLASSLSDYITGSTVDVNGGYLMR